MLSRALTQRTGALQAPQLDYFLIDGSGSMMEKWWESQAAMRGYLDVLKGENVSSHGVVQIFDNHDLASVQRDAPLVDWPDFADHPLVASWGMTPLYDAINLMARELAALDPARCAITIITDGDENGSRHTSSDQAKALLDWCRAKGWQVTFLGADFNNSRQAKLLGANASNSIGVQKHKLEEAGKLLGHKRAKNARYGHDINFSDEEKTIFGGYLSDGSKG